MLQPSPRPGSSPFPSFVWGPPSRPGEPPSLVWGAGNGWCRPRPGEGGKEEGSRPATRPPSPRGSRFSFLPARDGNSGASSGCGARQRAAAAPSSPSLPPQAGGGPAGGGGPLPAPCAVLRRLVGSCHPTPACRTLWVWVRGWCAAHRSRLLPVSPRSGEWKKTSKHGAGVAGIWCC